VAGLFVADTNLYVGAANDPEFRARFEVFIREHGPLLVSAVVMAEVLIGIPDTARHPAATVALAAGGIPAAPTEEDWVAAAGTVARLGGESVTKRRSFWNDALLAAQCARLGATLLTQNVSDFRRLGRHLALRATAPFPR
jgi:predicted nucleic acid-binding protein